MTFLHVVANLTYQIYYSVVTSIPEKSLNKFTYSFYAIFKCLDYVDSFSNNIDFGFISLSFTYLPTECQMSTANSKSVNIEQ
jgi:hypothetical protein